MLEIIFENREVLVINKPAGIMTHPDGRSTEDSVSNLLLKEFPYLANVGEPLILPNGTAIQKPGIVHRLDRETSGALLIAKNQEVFHNLKTQFQSHSVRKEYHAFVHGHIRQDTGTIDAAIARSPRDFRRWSAQRGRRGKEREAITAYTIAQRFTFENEKYTFVHLFPKTGRTHQLRVHMKYLNHPIVSDQLYNSGKGFNLGFKRTALHARKICFKIFNEKEEEVVADYSKDFQNATQYIS